MASATVAPPFATVSEALEEIRAGRMVVVVDDADRENEGDLTLAAESVTPEAINFMAVHGRGLICCALTEQRLEALAIPLMTQDNTSNFGTAFCESVDARDGVTTGISAADRSRTILRLVDSAARAADLARPGHVFPLRARAGGVLSRAGQTEAAVDLARLAGLQPAGVICEIMNADGTMARVPELDLFCRHHQLKMITVADLIRHRLLHERYVHRLAETPIATAAGAARLITYRSSLDEEQHAALVFGDIRPDEPTLVRVQNHCLLGALGGEGCDCRANLAASLARLRAASGGVLIYLHHTSPGYSLEAGCAVHNPVQTETTAASAAEPTLLVQRQVGVGAQILADLGVRSLRLLTDHPRRWPGLDGWGLHLIEQVPLRS
ncbi:MAG: 3,4-dihydroxy-2-butanone-4-phosphate synthase [Terriglobales bacterium]